MARRTNTVRFIASSTLSLLGNSVAGIVLPLVLLARTGDALAAGSLALICAVPQMLAGLLGGALLDRVNRRNVSVAADFISAFSVALIPVVDMVWGLNFWWFVALGLLGAVGDIPGMTARDTLLPAVVKRDDVDLQRFLGFSQSLDSLTTIVGPALAALLIGFGGEVEALWVTAALSCAAALVTCTLPRSVGAVCTTGGGAVAGCGSDAGASDMAGLEAAGNTAKADGTRASDAFANMDECSEQALYAEAQGRSLAAAAKASLLDGLHVLFKDDALLRASTLLTFGIVMVLGSFQGLVLPVYFTEAGQPELLGYVLSTMSGGLLIGSLAYSALALRLSKRTWFVVSLAGTAVGVAVMGVLPSYPLMLTGAAVLGFTAGPASALLGFFAYDRIPEGSRGAALGTQNALMLAAAPVAMFATSIVASAAGVAVAAAVLVVCWLAVIVLALRAKSLRELDAMPRELPLGER